MSRKKLNWVYLVGSVLLLTACSATETAVNWSDTFIAYRINRQFEFKGATRDLIKAESTQAVNDFRKKQFPRISNFFKESSRQFSTLDLKDEAKVRAFVTDKFERVENFWNTLPAQVEPFALKVAAQIKKENWQAFRENFEKENQKYLKEKSQCPQKLGDQVEEWIGSLSKEQESSLEKFCETRKDSYEMRVKNRRHQMDTFQRKLSEKSKGPDFNPASFQETVREWLLKNEEFKSTESKDKWKQSRLVLIQAFTEILMKATPAQKEHLLKTLEKRAATLDDLKL